MFTQKFDSFVIEGETITCIVDDVTYTATIVHDSDSSIDDDDMHNTDQSVTGTDDIKHATLMDNRIAYLNNEWWYGGVVISAERRDGWKHDDIASVWGIECNYPSEQNEHLTEIANELLKEYLNNDE